MKLDQYYSLEKDPMQWILHYRKEGELNEKGKPIISESKWYFPSMKIALKNYCDRVLEPDDTAVTILEQIEKLEAKIDQVCTR